MKGEPTERGFDRYFGHLSPWTNFFKGDETYRLDGQPYQVPEEGFYTTDNNTEQALTYLKERDPQKPFFLYMAYNAPHYPLHVKKLDFDKYKKTYTEGWQKIRKARFEKQKQLGIIPKDTTLSPQPTDFLN